jgi:hypothetical protein
LIVTAVQSTANGTIYITYQIGLLPAGYNILAISPIDPAVDVILDLSSAAEAGTPFAWVCGIA